MRVNYQDGAGRKTILGNGRFRINRAAVFIGKTSPDANGLVSNVGAAITGTVQVSGSTVAGTGTDFLTDIRDAGIKFIKIGTVGVFEIVSFASATSLSLKEKVTIPAGAFVYPVSETVTGVNTKFTSDYVVGDMIQVGDDKSTFFAPIISITSDTTLTVYFGRWNSQSQPFVVAGESSAHRKHTKVWVGDTDKVELKAEETSQTLGGQGFGENAETVITGGKGTLSFGLAQPSLMRMLACMPGLYDITRDPSTGEPVQAKRTSRTGMSARDNTVEVQLVEWEERNGVANPLQRIKIYECFSTAKDSYTFDGKSGQNLPVEFTVFESQSIFGENGQPAMWEIG